MEADIQFPNLDISNLKIPALPALENSISLQMFEISHYQGNNQNEDSNISFTNSPYKQTHHSNIFDQNSMRLPSSAYQCNTFSSGKKLILGFNKQDLNPQFQQNNQLFNEIKEEYQNNNEFPLEIIIKREADGFSEIPQFKQKNKLQQSIVKAKLLSTKADSSKGNSSIHSFGLMKQFNKKAQVKGLKELSLQVKEVIDKRKTVTYKEISDIIIQQQTLDREVNKLNQIGDVQKSNQNIKRRIYDCLNVLVAVGVFKRNGKKGLVKNNETIKNDQPNKAQIKVKEDLYAQIKKAKARIQQKSAIRDAIFQKYNTLQKLCDRNKSSQFEQSQKLFGPLFFTKTRQQQIQKSISINGEMSNQVSLKLSSQTSLTSDLDMLTKYSNVIFSTK